MVSKDNMWTIVLSLLVVLFLGCLLMTVCVTQRPRYHAETLEEIRYPVSIDFLSQYIDSGGDSISSYFSVAKVINGRPDILNAISTSLFCKDVDSRGDTDTITPSFAPGSRWYNKYMQSLVNNIKTVFKDPVFAIGWKLRIYVAYDISQMDPIMKQLSHPRVEIFVMTSSSVGAQPGMMWRFLACGDRSLNLAFVLDIDEEMRHKSRFITLFAKYPDKLLMKQSGKIVRVSASSDSMNATIIIGSFSLWRPKLLDLDLARLMGAFMRYRVSMSSTSEPWAYFPSEPKTVWNSAVDKHVFGWGNHWFMYGFDERFLDHVLFYHVAAKGGIVSPTSTQYAFPEVYDYLLKIPGNIFASYGILSDIFSRFK